MGPGIVTFAIVSVLLIGFAILGKKRCITNVAVNVEVGHLHIERRQNDRPSRSSQSLAIQRRTPDYHYQ